MILVRARLRRDASVAALARLLLPEEPNARVAATHRLMWSLFADRPDRERDFLWREDKPGQFLILAARAPQDGTGLFELEHQSFAPDLSPGDRLGFMLRANATVQPGTAYGTPRRPRSDVVMHALHHIPKGDERPNSRQGQVQQAGTAWLERQAATAGFALVPGRLRVDGYETWRIPRDPGADGRARPPVRYSTLDFSGVLCPTNPDRFLVALACGFGRARAFGCGLMLIRRVPA